jgi:hypothetical protein
VQAGAGLGYANVKMMQYDVKHSGENKMMDVVEIVKCTLPPPYPARFQFEQPTIYVHVTGPLPPPPPPPPPPPNPGERRKERGGIHEEASINVAQNDTSFLSI